MSKTVIVTVELTAELEDELADLVAALVKRHGTDLFHSSINAPWSFYDYEPDSKTVGVTVDGAEAR